MIKNKTICSVKSTIITRQENGRQGLFHFFFFFFICIFVTVTYVTHNLLLLNLLKLYNASCIEINSNMLIDLIIFSVFLMNNE